MSEATAASVSSAASLATALSTRSERAERPGARSRWAAGPAPPRRPRRRAARLQPRTRRVAVRLVGVPRGSALPDGRASGGRRLSRVSGGGSRRSSRRSWRRSTPRATTAAVPTARRGAGHRGRRSRLDATARRGRSGMSGSFARRRRRPRATRRSPGSGSGRTRSAGHRPDGPPRRTEPPTGSPTRSRRRCCRSPSPRPGGRRPWRRGSRRSPPRGRPARRPRRGRRSRRPRWCRPRPSWSTSRSRSRIVPASTSAASSRAISPVKLAWPGGELDDEVVDGTELVHVLVRSSGPPRVGRHRRLWRAHRSRASPHRDDRDADRPPWVIERHPVPPYRPTRGGPVSGAPLSVEEPL